jgi:glycosyltransferase involved in cell wall biosynthesis
MGSTISAAHAAGPRIGSAETPPTVDIVIPVHNEEAVLAASVTRLHEHLRLDFPFPWRITIVDNASTDRTWGLACRLATELDRVRSIRLDRKGRGRALRTVWSTSDAAVLAYMDVDLSTDLDALLPLVAPLVSGHSDVAIGTRLSDHAHVVRGPRRELISRAYNLLLHATLRVRFSDAQCGFKAVRRDIAQLLLPMVEDDEWFFDTELLVLAERNGLRIHEVPVDWVDDPDSRVDVASTAKSDLAGIARMLRRFARGDGRLEPADPRVLARASRDGLTGQIIRFATIGLVSTTLFAILFVALVDSLGPVGADIVALGICALGNTAANRRVTFSMRGPENRVRQLLSAAVLTLGPLVLNLATLGVLGWLGVAGTPTLLVALTVVNLLAAASRFVLLRRWVFAPSPR